MQHRSCATQADILYGDRTSTSKLKYLPSICPKWLLQRKPKQTSQKDAEQGHSHLPNEKNRQKPTKELINKDICLLDPQFQGIHKFTISKVSKELQRIYTYAHKDLLIKCKSFQYQRISAVKKPKVDFVTYALDLLFFYPQQMQTLSQCLRTKFLFSHFHLCILYVHHGSYYTFDMNVPLNFKLTLYIS